MSEYEALLAEHRQIQILNDRLRVIVAAPEDTLPEPRWRRLLTQEIESFGVRLSAHFAREEAGGYFAEVAERRPELSTKIDGLQAQHKGFVDELAEIVAGVREGVALSEILGRIHARLDALAAHESDEDALLQDGMLTDIGASD